MAEGIFTAEGVKIVNELLRHSQWPVLELFAVKEWIDAAGTLSVPVTEITAEELERISSLSTPNQVLALVKQPANPLPPAILSPGITLALSGIRDPGNLGTIIRTADWFGVRHIVCSEDCAELYNPKVIQATMGSFLRVQVIYAELDNFFRQHPSVPVYAALLNGETYTQQTKPGTGILLVGSESHGIDKNLLPFCTHRVLIDRKGGAESLNAAVACGILLAHFC